MSTHPKEVILIRHGQCQSNATEMFQAGSQIHDDHLTEQGIEEARAAARQFKDIKIDAIVSSSYLRARQTAALINEVIKAPHTVPLIAKQQIFDVEPDDYDLFEAVPSLLREIDLPAELAGLKYEDEKAAKIKRRMSRAHSIKLPAYPARKHYSNEENLFDLWQRAERMTEYIESRPEKRIMVVAHGGIMKVWLAHILLDQGDHDIKLLASLQKPLKTREELRAYSKFAQNVWWDNTGMLGLRYDPSTGWQLPIANVSHLDPLYLNIMGPKRRAEDHLTSDAASEYLD